MESAKKKNGLKTVPQMRGKESEGQQQIDTKKILFLHKSNSAQLRIVRNFRYALTAKTEGTVHVTDFINIAHAQQVPRSSAWLNESNNVVLLCLTPEDVDEFQKIILEKGFADQNGQLHPKVFSVTFGESLASKWPPQGLKKGSGDMRDFHFGFSDVEKIRPQDFERSVRLNSLIAAIKLTR